MMFKGTGVALVTPFTQNDEVDVAALTNLVNHVILNGVSYVVALGTTAETPTLKTAEKELVLDTVIAAAAGRVPVVCGIGGNDTSGVINQIQQYRDKKIDGILSVAPYYNKPTQAGVIAHYNAIAKATSLPIILYNVPGRTVTNILPDTAITLAKTHKNIVAIKEASGNMVQVMDLVQRKPENFMVLSGDDNLVLPQIAVGFEGVISVAANCYTAPFTEMVREAMAGNFSTAKALHYSLLTGIDLLFKEGNPAGVKYVLYKMGLVENTLRLPLVPISASTALEIDEFLTRLRKK